MHKNPQPDSYYFPEYCTHLFTCTNNITNNNNTVNEYGRQWLSSSLQFLQILLFVVKERKEKIVSAILCLRYLSPVPLFQFQLEIINAFCPLFVGRSYRFASVVFRLAPGSNGRDEHGETSAWPPQGDNYL